MAPLLHVVQLLTFILKYQSSMRKSLDISRNNIYGTTSATHKKLLKMTDSILKAFKRTSTFINYKVVLLSAFGGNSTVYGALTGGGATASIRSRMLFLS